MGFQIVGARESDWSLIVERSKETVWRDLSPQRREGLKKGLVAKDEKGRFAGYIWLTENTDYFTGQKQAFILDIYREKRRRRKGLGQRFLSLRDPVRRTGREVGTGKEVPVHRHIGGRS
ncbi:MAG: GNAT family N-acetyltransferase [Anaerolineae bacterium]